MFTRRVSVTDGTSRRGAMRWRRAAACVIFAGAVASPAHADDARQAGWEHRARQVQDLVVLRPLALAQTLVSVSAFAVAYPIALLFGHGDAVRENLLTDPVDRTFRRPLGQL